MNTKQQSGAKALFIDAATSWRARAADLRRWAAADGAARALEAAAEDVEEIVRRLDDEVLSMKDAALESGYSEEHIRRTLRQQPDLNAGRRGKPSIRRSDLPRKARSLARRNAAAYDPAADAQSLMSRQGAK